jgi:hypothetical protein
LWRRWKRNDDGAVERWGSAAGKGRQGVGCGEEEGAAEAVVSVDLGGYHGEVVLLTVVKGDCRRANCSCDL